MKERNRGKSHKPKGAANINLWMTPTTCATRHARSTADARCHPAGQIAPQRLACCGALLSRGVWIKEPHGFTVFARAGSGISSRVSLVKFDNASAENPCSPAFSLQLFWRRRSILVPDRTANNKSLSAISNGFIAARYVSRSMNDLANGCQSRRAGWDIHPPRFTLSDSVACMAVLWSMQGMSESV
jgi:hypothetical protein